MKIAQHQVAEYIRDLSTELAIYARKSGLHGAAYMLELAAAEVGDAQASVHNAVSKSPSSQDSEDGRRP